MRAVRSPEGQPGRQTWQSFSSVARSPASWHTLWLPSCSHAILRPTSTKTHAENWRTRPRCVRHAALDLALPNAIQTPKPDITVLLSLPHFSSICFLLGGRHSLALTLLQASPQVPHHCTEPECPAAPSSSCAVPARCRSVRSRAPPSPFLRRILTPHRIPDESS